MAGDWIPISLRLKRKPEVAAISIATGQSLHEVMGILVDLWSWASEVSRDGDAPASTYETLSVSIGCDVAFFDALERVGWIRRMEKNGTGITIPNWDRWFSSSAKARELKNLRQQKWRRKRDANVDAAASRDETREENRREDDDDDDIPSGMSSQLSDKPPSKRTPVGPTAEEIIARWNQLAERHGLSPIRKVCAGRTDDRRKTVAARLKEIPDLWEQLDEALAKRDAWARSKKIPAFDQAMRPALLTKLLEGFYDEHEEHKQDNTISAWRKAEAERRARLGEAADVME